MRLDTPGARVPADLAAWSGVWEGVLDRAGRPGSTGITVAVEHIEPTHVIVQMRLHLPDAGWLRFQMDRDYRVDAWRFHVLFPADGRLDERTFTLTEVPDNGPPRLLLEVGVGPGAPPPIRRAHLQRVR